MLNAVTAYVQYAQFAADRLRCSMWPAMSPRSATTPRPDSNSSKARPIAPTCHSGDLLSDEDFHNTGVGTDRRSLQIPNAT